MRLTIIVLLATLWTSVTFAEESLPEPTLPPPQVNMYLAINGYCKPEEFGWPAAAALKQEPLFYGQLLVNMGPHPTQSQPVWVQLWSMVNQDTGHFSMFARMPDGMMCLLGSGNSFTPYTGPALKDIVPSK